MIQDGNIYTNSDNPGTGQRHHRADLPEQASSIDSRMDTHPVPPAGSRSGALLCVRHTQEKVPPGKGLPDFGTEGPGRGSQ